MIDYTSLPDDMQSLIFDFVGRDFDAIPKTLPTRQVKISDIPVVELDVFDRGSAYARRLTPENAPPLIIADNHFLDGKHRCFSFRELGVESYLAIDLSGIADPDMVEQNSMGLLLSPAAKPGVDKPVHERSREHNSEFDCAP